MNNKTALNTRKRIIEQIKLKLYDLNFKLNKNNRKQIQEPNKYTSNNKNIRDELEKKRNRLNRVLEKLRMGPRPKLKSTPKKPKPPPRKPKPPPKK